MTVKIFGAVMVELFKQRLQLLAQISTQIGCFPLIHLFVVVKIELLPSLCNVLIRLKTNIARFLAAFKLINLVSLRGRLYL